VQSLTGGAGDYRQDWRVNFRYPVYVLYGLGFISAAMDLHYHYRPAFEVMWMPYGGTSYAAPS